MRSGVAHDTASARDVLGDARRAAHPGRAGRCSRGRVRAPRPAPGARPRARPRAGTRPDRERRGAGRSGHRGRPGQALAATVLTATRRVQRPTCPSRAAPRASPRRRAGRRRRQRCCARCRDPPRAPARMAVSFRRAACRRAPPRAARPPARPGAACLTTRGGGRDRRKWPTFLAWNWILILSLSARSVGPTPNHEEMK